MFFHSSSFIANPIACAAAAANQRDRLDALASLPHIRNARALGTIIAVAVANRGGGYLADLAPRVLASFRERDLLLRPLGDTVHVMPPYCIEDDDLDRVYAGIAEAAGLT